jgi:hypothetical protein
LIHPEFIVESLASGFMRSKWTCSSALAQELKELSLCLTIDWKEASIAVETNETNSEELRPRQAQIETPPVRDAGQPTQTQTVVQPSQDTEATPPYGFRLAAISLVLVSLVAFSAMLIFRDLFENATDVTTVLSTLFTVVGTVVGTYFGIKTSGDTRDKLQGSIDKANETANRAMAALPPEKAREVTGPPLPQR